MSCKIDVERFLEAEDLTSYRCSQVQGFFYSNQDAGAGAYEGIHLVRDLTLPAGSQIVWQKESEDYVSANAEAAKEIERYRLQIIADEYELLSNLPKVEAP